MDKLIDALLERHNGDMRQCLAWAIGYIDRLERDKNQVRDTFGFMPETTLIEDLREDV